LMKPKDFRELFQHYHRRAIARFCVEPRTFEEVISHMMEKAGWNQDLAYVLVGEHMAVLEKSQAVRRVDTKWVTTEAAAEALRKYF
jgi:hypothetical protein